MPRRGLERAQSVRLRVALAARRLDEFARHDEELASLVKRGGGGSQRLGELLVDRPGVPDLVVFEPRLVAVEVVPRGERPPLVAGVLDVLESERLAVGVEVVKEPDVAPRCAAAVVAHDVVAGLFVAADRHPLDVETLTAAADLRRSVEIVRFGHLGVELREKVLQRPWLVGAVALALTRDVVLHELAQLAREVLDDVGGISELRERLERGEEARVPLRAGRVALDPLAVLLLKRPQGLEETRGGL